MSYEEAVELYLSSLEGTRAIPMQPSSGISQELNGAWYLANVRGPMARVTADGEVEDPDKSDSNWRRVKAAA